MQTSKHRSAARILKDCIAATNVKTNDALRNKPSPDRTSAGHSQYLEEHFKVLRDRATVTKVEIRLTAPAFSGPEHWGTGA